ncbi:MAG: hypothetical protein AAF500_05530 [Myxococcota bacterium]
MEALVYPQNFAAVRSASGNRVDLEYDLDRDRWPWLSLEPRHPVLIEKYQYFGAVTAVLAQQLVDTSTFTALTQFEWACVGRGDRHATCGVYVDSSSPGAPRFELTLVGPDGVVLAKTEGSGFAFTDRDVGAWRSASRTKALAASVPGIDAFAAASEAGLPPDGASFLAPPETVDGKTSCRGVVQTNRAFHPAHPFHTGSGDHVNAGHLFDCALQFAHLLGRATQPCTGGRAQFFRFVELDVPFEIVSLDATRTDANAASALFRQLDRDSAKIELQF